MSSSPEAPRRALVIAMRYLGDVLLATPLVHALRARYPDCAIDMLVFKGTEGILQNNPDIDAVLTVPERSSGYATLGMVRRLWRRYDVALIPQPGDKPHLFGWAAAPIRWGLVPQKPSRAWWKRLSVRSPLVEDASLHRVDESQRLASLLGIGPAYTVVPPRASSPLGALAAKIGPDLSGARNLDPNRPYAIIHPSPRWRYKQWPMEGWRSMLSRLAGRGMQIVVSGGPGPAESGYIDRILEGLPAPMRPHVFRAQGKLGLGELADLLRAANLYVGPDTATTHLAAACGTPTLAIYGPTDPTLWAPWPPGGPSEPWRRVGARQARGNVMLVQNPEPSCVPCQEEGCDRHRSSHSRCLDQLSVESVWAAAEELLDGAGRDNARKIAIRTV